MNQILSTPLIGDRLNAPTLCSAKVSRWRATLRVSSFGSIGPSPSSAGKTHGLRTAMRFRRLNCSTAGGVSGTAKATPVLVRSAGMSQTGALASRSNADQQAAVSSDRLTAVRRISRIAIPVRFARLVTSSPLQACGVFKAAASNAPLRSYRY